MVNLTEKHIETIREALHAYLSDACEGRKFGDYDDAEYKAIEADVDSVEDALAYALAPISPISNHWERCLICDNVRTWYGHADDKPLCACCTKENDELLERRQR